MFKRYTIEYVMPGMSSRGFRFGGGKGGDDFDLPDVKPIKADNPSMQAPYSAITEARMRGTSGIQASQLTKFWNEPLLGDQGLVGQPLGATQL